MTLVSERFVLPVSAPNGLPKLLVEVKRYTSSKFPPAGTMLDIDKTLVLTHGVGFLKELWEPTLSHFFELQSHHNHRVRIREAWAIDCPNHGVSAALNDHVFRFGYLATFKDYTRAVTTLLASGLIDLRRHSLIAIGHSAGSAALAGAADAWFRMTGTMPFYTLIMIEPPMISAELDAKYNDFNANLAVRAVRRRSQWASREEAALWLGQRQRFWNPRCLHLYTEFGLRKALPFASDVVLSCTGVQEAACYSLDEQVESLAVLARLCPLLPVHTIFAEFVDLVPHSEVQDNLVNAAHGRKMASVTRMPLVGHFAPFQSPKTCAQAIFNCLYLLHGHASGIHGSTDARL